MEKQEKESGDKSPHSKVQTPADLRIVPYKGDRKQEIVDLLNLCLARKLTGERDVAYWCWKHEQNPFGPSLLLLAEADGKLVGVRAFMRWQLDVDGQPCAAAKPVDTVTHPDYQGRGIFRRLTVEACEMARRDGVAVVFNTPNGNSLPGYLKLGWQRVAELPLFIKLLRPVSAAFHMVGRRLGWSGVPSVESFFHEPPQDATAVLERVAAGVQELLSDATPAGQLRTARTIAFLRWRYAGHPHIRYFAETVEHGPQVEGVLFYRTNFRAGLREVLIDDVLLRWPSVELLSELVRRLRQRVRADYVLAHGAPGGGFTAGLRNLGFHRLPGRRITLVAKQLDERFQPDPFQAANWSLCLGDLEGL